MEEEDISNKTPPDHSQGKCDYIWSKYNGLEISNEADKTFSFKILQCCERV